MPKRDVSPLGTSRFENPPPTGQPRPSTSTSSSVADIQALPSRRAKRSDDSATTPISALDDHHGHRSKPSLASTAPTYTTAATASDELEQASEDGHSSGCPPIQDRDAWFAQQTEEELDIPVDGDECPDRATLAAVQNIPVYDADGNAIPFGSLYDPDHAPHQRQLIIFVRWFYCGACQAFVKALTRGISMEDYFNIPTPTSMVIISCGQPDLIPQYVKLTDNCPFTILTDPTRELFKKLGMRWSVSLGPQRPDYMKDISVMKVLKNQIRDVSSSIKDADGIRKRDVFRGGNMLQIGGEFLFEDGQVIWCHRMRHMRGRKLPNIRKLTLLLMNRTV